MAQLNIPLNLAREPFQKNRPILVASTVLAVLLMVTLGLQVNSILAERSATRETRERQQQMQRQLTGLNAEVAKLQSRLRLPENAAVFERSQFINMLLLRKGISWTRLFDDLEKVMPSTVRLIAVRPSVTADNLVQLDMVVGAKEPEPVIELLKRLENSQLFGATALLSSQPPTQQDPLHRYRVSVNYAQKL
jgi:type IV pilus assembly protein PilN